MGLALAISTGPVAALAPTSAEALDARFARWARKLARLEARIEAAPQETDADQDRIDALCDRAGVLEDIILSTPSNTRVAAEIKLRTLIRYFGRDNSVAAVPARHILAFVERLP